MHRHEKEVISMVDETTTLMGKVRHCIELHPEIYTAEDVALAVWRTFYYELFRDMEDVQFHAIKHTGPFIGELDLLTLPSLSDIRSCFQKIEKEKSTMPENVDAWWNKTP